MTRVELPPLRSRPEDIPMLAAHFQAQAGGVGPLPADLLARWRDEPWPGNVVIRTARSLSAGVSLGSVKPKLAVVKT